MLHVGIRSVANDVLLPEEQELDGKGPYGQLDANARRASGALEVWNPEFGGVKSAQNPQGARGAGPAYD